MNKKSNLYISLVTIVFVIAVVTAFVGSVVANENEIGWITAVVTNEEVYAADPNANEEKLKERPNLPVSREQYVPRPFPMPKKDIVVTQLENRTVSYNPVTGQETIYESQRVRENIPVTARSQGRRSIKKETQKQRKKNEAQLLNFGSLLPVTNPDDYPWSVNVKLYMTFPSGYCVGSGVLIDPLHVLTVGHNVYEHEGGGAWATEIMAIPAYENGYEPYGLASAWATNLYSWTGWIVDENLNHDMAIIELDRPIGFRTGWYGYGYNNLCSFFTGNNFYLVGYPAASPYDGEYMYYRYGSFDSCFTYELRFDSQSYAGQSGSGVHHVDAGDRTVYAVLSHGPISSPFYTDCTRITSNKYFDISDYINSNTPTTVDLIPMEVQASPVVIAPGEQLTSMTYQVHNYSSASWSGTVYADVYLSTNDIISSYDTLIQTHSFAHTFNPKSSYTVNVSTAPTIPPEFANGNYWIGVILDVSDHDTGNNNSSGDDACTIVVSDTGECSSGTEDFEAGDFSSFPWYHSGSADWVITSNGKNSGVYSAKAGTIGHNQNTNLQVTLDCISQDIRFYRKVSSESNYDYLKFYIDGVLKGSWSGSVDWSQVSCPVSAGTRTFKWTYSKDSSVSSGSDTAWIDDIVFPVQCSDEDCNTINIGTGTSTWTYPMHTYYHDSRTQVIYLSSEIESSGNITTLALDVETVPGQEMDNWTIRMRHIGMSSYNTPSFEPAGWTVVYQWNEPAGSPGWRTFNFSTPFEYNGTDNLLVDFSYNNSSYTSNGSCKYSTPGGIRSAYAYSDSGYGDPLDWSGTTSPSVYSTSNVPNIKLTICGSNYVGDFNNSGTVDFADFAILAGQWQQPPGSPSADIAPEVPDNFVDVLDLSVFVENWLTSSTP